MDHSPIPSPTSRSSATSAAALHHPMTRSDPNSPYPTTFVQADTSSFKQVVQMLTGSTQPQARPTRPNKPTSKLYERRHTFRISPLGPGSASGHGPTQARPEILSPSILDFPSLMLSPVTPLIPDPFNRELATEVEDRAIKEKGFYLHPSPVTTPRESEPRLLPLFPVTSPRAAGDNA